MQSDNSAMRRMKFLGSYTYQLDDKGRVSLPAAFRNVAADQRFVLIQVTAPALSLYPETEWVKVEERLSEMMRYLHKLVQRDLSLTTTNGGIRLDAVAGRVEGRTTNGGVDVRLDGQRWAGDGLELRTTNGAITLHVPQECPRARVDTDMLDGSPGNEVSRKHVPRFPVPESHRRE